MINKAPIYCDICKSVDLLSLERSLTLRLRTATRIQVALNVAIPACSLCINRRLCKIATAKAAMTTNSERRRAVIQDLLIGVGIPILQIVARECAYPFHVNTFTRMNQDYVASPTRYYIFEDYGPFLATVTTPLSFILFYTWPLAIGVVSFFYSGEYSSLSPFFGALGAHRFQSRPFARSTSTNVSLSRRCLRRVLAVAGTSG